MDKLTIAMKQVGPKEAVATFLEISGLTGRGPTKVAAVLDLVGKLAQYTQAETDKI